MLTKFCFQDDQPDHLQLLSLFKQQVKLISLLTKKTLCQVICMKQKSDYIVITIKLTQSFFQC